MECMAFLVNVSRSVRNWKLEIRFTLFTQYSIYGIIGNRLGKNKLFILLASTESYIFTEQTYIIQD